MASWARSPGRERNARQETTLQGHARQVWGQATELIGTGQQQQYALAAKQADEAQKAATPKEVEGPKAAHTAIQRAERNYEVEEIFDRCTENNVAGYRVKWKGYSAQHNSWEPENALAGAVAVFSISFGHPCNQMRGLIITFLILEMYSI